MSPAVSVDHRSRGTRVITLAEREAALRRLPTWEQVRTAWSRLVSLPAGRAGLAVLIVDPDGAAARIVDGGDAGSGPLLAAVVVGRHFGADLWLDADTASRRHLVVVAHGTGLSALDLRTPAGTIGACAPERPGDPLVIVVGDVVVVAAVAAPGHAFPALPLVPAVEGAGVVVRPTPKVSALVHRGVARVELPFDDGLLVGRGERCDVIVLDEGVSRIHAALLRVDGTPIVVDLGSTNGTSVRRRGGGEVALGPARRACSVQPGDVLDVGGVTLAVHDLRAPAEPAPGPPGPGGAPSTDPRAPRAAPAPPSTDPRAPPPDQG